MFFGVGTPAKNVDPPRGREFFAIFSTFRPGPFQLQIQSIPVFNHTTQKPNLPIVFPIRRNFSGGLRESQLNAPPALTCATHTRFTIFVPGPFRAKEQADPRSASPPEAAPRFRGFGRVEVPENTYSCFFFPEET